MFVFVKQKTAVDMRFSDWSSDVCSTDLNCPEPGQGGSGPAPRRPAPRSARAGSGDGQRGAKAAVVTKFGGRRIAGPACVPFVVGVADGADIIGGVEKARQRFGIERLEADRKSPRLNSSHYCASRLPSSA